MTTTPNPTAEHIVHDAIWGTKLMESELRTLLANDSWALSLKAVAALRAAGLLGGDPSEVTSSTSDGHHTFDELYAYRMAYHAHAAVGWIAAGIPVVKSRRHSDGELCFGGGWFIVVADLPTGQVSNHYREEYWDLFQVPSADPPEYDGHTPDDALQRLLAAAAGVAPQEPCPQPCEHLSAEDAREGRGCREHPCTCPTSPSSDREKLIAEAEIMDRLRLRVANSHANDEWVCVKIADLEHVLAALAAAPVVDEAKPYSVTIARTARQAGKSSVMVEQLLERAGERDIEVRILPPEVDEAKLAEVVCSKRHPSRWQPAHRQLGVCGGCAEGAHITSEWLRGGGR